MNRKGFAFMESIIAIVFVTSSLLLLYGSFKKISDNKKMTSYNDEIGYIYRTEYLRELLVNDLNNLKTNLTTEIPYLKVNINGYEDSFYHNLFTDYEVKNILLIKEDGLKKLKNCLYSASCELDISSSFKDYLKKLNIDLDTSYLLAVEYETCLTSCHNYYSWVSV